MASALSSPWIRPARSRQAGYEPLAPDWPGDPDTVEGARENPDSIADHGIDDVVAHYAKVIEGLDGKPILVGHSFGGMIAQKLVGQDLAAATIAIDSGQIKGVLPLPLSALRATLPVFKNPTNKHKAVSLTAEQFRYAFGNAISGEESQELYERWAIPAPGRPCSRPPRRTSTPMFRSFTDRADVAPYTAATAPLAKESAQMDFTKEDRAPAALLNRAIWESVKVAGIPMPAPRSAPPGHLPTVDHWMEGNGSVRGSATYRDSWGVTRRGEADSGHRDVRWRLQGVRQRVPRRRSTGPPDRGW